VCASQGDAAGEEEFIKIRGQIGPGVLQHASRTRKGRVPYNRNKLNQDRAFMSYNLQNDPTMACWGVMDGHGEFGHEIAHFLQDALPNCLAGMAELKGSPEKGMTEAVRRACDELTETPINVSFSGSTVCFALKVAEMLYVGNVGDSVSQGGKRGERKRERKLLCR
jgi:serine/threonine protein phosphatase PrpC